MHGREARLPLEMEKTSAVHDPTQLQSVQHAIDRLQAVREIFSDVSKNIHISQEKQKHQYKQRKGLITSHIKEGDVVMRLNMIKRTKKGHKHEDTWLGPYKVMHISKYGCCHLHCIATGKDVKTKVKINQLKIYKKPPLTAEVPDQTKTALAVEGASCCYQFACYSNNACP